ncbi:ABC transporter permease [Polaromonas sp.]|uniref:ABC transporter permease n=1 Tax=Polaromonas sp. TaxID=1869339 RepID=UPI001852AE79|nr:ABC transporter permease [Polaromonas sp.]NMM08280.1 ABC transporter permease [Polaromonas sp.]
MSAWVKNRVLGVLLLAGLAAALGLAFLTHAPNRLVTGTAISLAEIVSSLDGLQAAHGVFLLLTLLPALLLVAGVFMRPTRAAHALLGVAATLLLMGLVGLAASHANRLAGSAGASSIARTSFGGAFWLLAALSWLVAADAIGRLALKPVWRLLASATVIAPVLALLAAGTLGQLSLLKEYANRESIFNAALLQHLQLVLASLLPALLIGVPLGIAAVRARGRAVRAPLFAVLNIIQTVPSIALFGLLMAPLALLAAGVPLLAQWGIKGIGLAPAVIALTLYSLLPIVRSTAAGLGQVPQPVIDAALGMGLTRPQIFWKVELPLALPIFLSGLRVATVQVIGLAMVAALIGAGGFGTLMFQGLLSGALDLVLLGVVPVVALALAVDAVLRAVTLLLAPKF